MQGHESFVAFRGTQGFSYIEGAKITTFISLSVIWGCHMIDPSKNRLQFRFSILQRFCCASDGLSVATLID